MTRDRVDRLDLAAKTLWGPDVDQRPVCRQPRSRIGVEDRQTACVGNEIAGCDDGFVGDHRKPRRHPGRISAVENPHVAMTEVAQLPPRPRGRNAVCGVVGHKSSVAADTESSHEIFELRSLGQWMATASPAASG